eukprot:TRINITY_DN1718_c0_g1_i4.p1 TRINITY_DN1718_c0_g1~~TRINITY_DN1718_c0_g1_i4.p1  ORF type:complete len:612 (+),score=107.25 TRINITY_DN1718_c0_g1_i4:1041-2876(+)
MFDKRCTGSKRSTFPTPIGKKHGSSWQLIRYGRPMKRTREESADDSPRKLSSSNKQSKLEMDLLSLLAEPLQYQILTLVGQATLPRLDEEVDEARTEWDLRKLSLVQNLRLVSKTFKKMVDLFLQTQILSMDLRDWGHKPTLSVLMKTIPSCRLIAGSPYELNAFDPPPNLESFVYYEEGRWPSDFKLQHLFTHVRISSLTGGLDQLLKFSNLRTLIVDAVLPNAQGKALLEARRNQSKQIKKQPKVNTSNPEFSEATGREKEIAEKLPKLRKLVYDEPSGYIDADAFKEIPIEEFISMASFNDSFGTEFFQRCTTLKTIIVDDAICYDVLKRMVGSHLKKLVLATRPDTHSVRFLGALLAQAPNLQYLSLSHTYIDEEESADALQRLERSIQKAGVAGLASVTDLYIYFLQTGEKGAFSPLNMKKKGAQTLLRIFPSLRNLSLQQLIFNLSELKELGSKLKSFKQIEPSYEFRGHKASRIEEFVTAAADSIENLQLVVEQYTEEKDTLTITSSALKRVRLFIKNDMKVHFKNCPVLVDVIVCKFEGDYEVLVTSSGCPWIPSTLTAVYANIWELLSQMEEEPDYELYVLPDYEPDVESGREDEDDEEEEE